MFGMQDQSIQVRAYAVTKATEDVGRVTKEPELQAAVVFGQKRMIATSEKHASAAKAVLLDKVENKQAIDDATETVIECIDEYSALAQDLRHLLIPTRKKDQDALPPEVLASRLQFLKEQFSDPSSAFFNLGRTQIAARMRPIHTALTKSDHVADKSILTNFGNAVDKLEKALSHLKDEELDDAGLFAALVEARIETTGVYRAFRQLLQGALGLSGSLHSVDDFVLTEIKKKEPEKAAEIQQALAEEADSSLAVPIVTTSGE